MPRREKRPAKGRDPRRDPRRNARREVPAEEPRRRRGRYLAGEANLPKYTPDIALRSIDGHLTRTGTQVMAWYRLAAQAWSFRSDSQREVLIRQIAAQLGELQGRWLHIRVTTRPYPVHMWAESFDNNALGRLPDVPGALGWDGFLEGEQRHLMGLSMSDKEVFLGIEVSGRSMLDRWVEKAAPVLGKVAPAAVAGRAVGAVVGGRAPRRSRRRQRPGRGARDRRRRRLADAPLVLAGPARAADDRPHEQLPLGGRRPRGVHRRRRHVPGAVRADGAGRGPAALGDGAAQRGRPDRRSDGRPAHPRGRRPVDAAQRPAAVPRRVVRPGLRAAPRGGHRRAAAPDGQGAQPDPALHARPRPRSADVAGPAGGPGARGRGRADQRADPAQHPALRLVAGRGVGPRRGRGGLARPAGARDLPAEGADRAPRGAVPLRARVHPRRAAGVDGLPAPRLGDVGGGRRARRHGQRGRPPRHHAGGDLHRDPAPGGVGPVARPGGPARVRAHRGGRRPGFGQVVPHRADRLQDAARGRPLDGARPVRAAGGR